jgi:hypothetical protein
MLTIEDIRRLSARYLVCYDEKFYYPYIDAGRKGDPAAILQLTRWKNVGKGGQPMNLSRPKKVAFDRLLRGLPRYLGAEGEAKLRRDFRWHAPVWSIFWCHVLYGTPIFDRYTNAAWQHLADERLLTSDKAVIKVPGHWDLFDGYRAWFTTELARLSTEDASITSRILDRALFIYGNRLLSGKSPIPSRPSLLP